MKTKIALLFGITLNIGVGLFIFRDAIWPADVAPDQVWVLNLGNKDNPFEEKRVIKLRIISVSKYYVKALRYIDGDSVFLTTRRRVFRWDWAERIK